MNNNKNASPEHPDAAYPQIPYAALIEQSLVGIYVLQDNRIKYSNHAFARLNGYELDDFVGRRLTDFVDEQHLAQIQKNIHQRIEQGSSLRYTTCARKRDGQHLYLEVHGSYTELDGRPAVAGVAIDVSERLVHEQALQHSREQLRTLVRHMTDIAERLRAEMAREIHDVLGGLLIAIKLDANRLKKQRADDPETTEIVDSMLASSQEGIALVREISEQLYPAALDHLGLAAALRNYFEHFCRRTGLQGDFQTDAAALPLTGAKALATYRIFQEALTNVARHACAEKVTVSIGCQQQLFRLEVEDDGRGLEASQPREGALGLLSMRERATEAGGSLAISSQEQGTRLCLQIPLQEEDHDPSTDRR